MMCESVTKILEFLKLNFCELTFLATQEATKKQEAASIVRSIIIYPFPMMKPYERSSQ